MTEEAIFAEALNKGTPAERAAYLDEACAGDATLRQRVETLLASHEAAGNFLGKPAIQCAAEEFAGQACAADTQGEPAAEEDAVEALDFLEPSDKPGALGRLGHYEVLEVIGRGGMGIVLRAFDGKLLRVVAIKVMAAQLATSGTARKRFTREAQAAAAVTHDHIVTIHAVEEANGVPHLVMQFVSGMSLQQRLDRSGPLEVREIVRIGMQSAAGLAAAHAHGLIHRDIKPANILLENGVERVKITDFGLARAAADASLTQTGVVAGTPQYMSPEQARGEVVDQRADLFSLGSVLYAMCTGRPPFRADSNIAVLKRVCDDTPSAIREANPQIPDWLVAIVARLHAKDPAERFGSAAEVAQLLQDHLAHLQHPSVVGPVAGHPPATPGTAGGEGAVGQPAPRRRRWAMAAAAVMLALIGGLGVTEATGVTGVRATVIRIFTSDGTLVVEIDDPRVKVTVEGDGGLLITGTGLEEIRLRPGSYRVHADREGKPVPLERELVSIAKGGREVVRVKIERPPVAAKAEKGAFVLLAREGIELRKYDTLAEAVQGASGGNTIEVRGNGPFVSPPVTLKNRPLTLRAGPGFHPVIRLDTAVNASVPLLTTDASLVLESLELGRTNEANLKGWPAMVAAHGPSVSATNCRFFWPSNANFATSSRVCRFSNCEFITGRASGLMWNYPDDGELILENCVQAGGGSVGLTYRRLPKTASVQIRVAKSSFRAECVLTMFTDAIDPGPAGTIKADEGGPIRLAISESVIDVDHPLRLGGGTPAPPGRIARFAKAIDSLLPRLLTWRDRQNLYAEDNFVSFVTLNHGEPMKPPPGPRTLADWDGTWGQSKTGSSRGRVLYQGGDPLARLALPPGRMKPEDFRLRPDSAGCRAGKDGKDLGADVDLVGPGKAYERWKKTPEYQQWLKDSGQVK